MVVAEPMALSDPGLFEEAESALCCNDGMRTRKEVGEAKAFWPHLAFVQPVCPVQRSKD